MRNMFENTSASVICTVLPGRLPRTEEKRDLHLLLFVTMISDLKEESDWNLRKTIKKGSGGNKEDETMKADQT